MKFGKVGVLWCLYRVSPSWAKPFLRLNIVDCRGLFSADVLKNYRPVKDCRPTLSANYSWTLTR